MIILGWEYLSTHWSKNGKVFTPEDFASHLKMIVSKYQSRSISAKPPVLLPVLKVLPRLGTQSTDVVTMDSALLETSDDFETQARRTILERGAVGIFQYAT